MRRFINAYLAKFIGLSSLKATRTRAAVIMMKKKMFITVLNNVSDVSA